MFPALTIAQVVVYLLIFHALSMKFLLYSFISSTVVPQLTSRPGKFTAAMKLIAMKLIRRRAKPDDGADE